MAVVKKLHKGAEKKAPMAKREVVLPDDVSEPSDALSDYSMLLYGAKKIGKTTLCAEFPDPLFLSTEPGTKALRVRSVQVPDWLTMVAAVEALEVRLKKDPDYCKTIAVDTVDLVYEYAFNYVCKKVGVTHPTEANDFGQTWRAVKTSFRDILMRLLRLPCGVIFVSHDTEREVETSDGSKVDRVQPTMSGQALGEVEGIVDIIGHYGFEGRRRMLFIRGRQTLVAGSRLRERFLRQGGKPGVPDDRVAGIPLGRTEREAYNAIIKAFNNQQEDTGVEEVPVKSKSVKLKKK